MYNSWLIYSVKGTKLFYVLEYNKKIFYPTKL